LSFFATHYCLNPPKQSAENKDFGFCLIKSNFDAHLQKTIYRLESVYYGTLSGIVPISGHAVSVQLSTPRALPQA
jgi:hypothetical protein